MTDHLPECKTLDVMPDATTMFHSTSRQWFWEHGCICDRLRACEQRVKRFGRPLWHLKGATWGHEQGWNEALDAAREAVSKAWHCPDPMNCTVDEPVCGNRREILAAIDALKETNVNT